MLPASPMPGTVLIVDDDPDIRDAFAECLRQEGYQVEAAPHGRAALDVLEAGLRPGVILLDLMMPVMNGFEFLESVRSRPDWQKLRVIVLSANRGYQAEDFQGVFRILRKPVDIEPLCKTIELALAA